MKLMFALQTAGILSSLCILYRLAPRKILLPTLDDSILPLLSMPFFTKYDNNSLIRKLRMKLTQRIGLCYLKPKLASWRYQRGSRSLRHNLDNKDDTTTAAHPSRTALTTNDEDDDDDISENLEIIIDLLLNGLKDKVRLYWIGSIDDMNPFVIRIRLSVGRLPRVWAGSVNDCLKNSPKMSLVLSWSFSKKTHSRQLKVVSSIWQPYRIIRGMVHPLLWRSWLGVDYFFPNVCMKRYHGFSW